MFFSFISDGGDPFLYNDDLFKRFVEVQKGNIVFVKMTTEVEKEKSIQANRYYWGAVIETISKETGTARNDTHYALCERFLPCKDTAIGRARKPYRELSQKEQSIYIDGVRQFAATELGLEIMTPEEWREANGIIQDTSRVG